jgi:hypothetical protein
MPRTPEPLVAPSRSQHYSPLLGLIRVDTAQGTPMTISTASLTEGDIHGSITDGPGRPSA